MVFGGRAIERKMEGEKESFLSFSIIENDRKDLSFCWPPGKIKIIIILLLKGVERVTKALPGVSPLKIAPLPPLRYNSISFWW